MYSKLTYFMIWSVIGSVLATSGVVTYVASGGVEQPPQRDVRPLAESRLLGVWDQQGSSGTYRLNVTPNVVFITSYDEQDVCEIDVLDHDFRKNGGIIRGVIRLHRTESDNLPLVDREVKIKYERYNEVLKLTWDESLELLPRLSQHQLIAMPTTQEVSGNLEL